MSDDAAEWKRELARWKHDAGLLRVALAKCGDDKRMWRQRAMTAERKLAVAKARLEKQEAARDG